MSKNFILYDIFPKYSKRSPQFWRNILMFLELINFQKGYLWGTSHITPFLSGFSHGYARVGFLFFFAREGVWLQDSPLLTWDICLGCSCVTFQQRISCMGQIPWIPSSKINIYIFFHMAGIPNDNETWTRLIVTATSLFFSFANIEIYTSTVNFTS